MAVAGQQVPPFPAPQDQELKNIIDKLANFVARNGTKFEEMTKTKQKDNPKFSFLFGGDYFNYYKWRVSVEVAQSKLIPQHLQSQGQSYPNAQASLVQQAIVQQSIQSAPWQQAQQVQQPQVTGQHNASQQPYQTSTESVNIPEFEGFLVKIMQSCTKENISNGKNWIFKHCKTEDHFKQVADYMLLRVTGAGMGFLHKLHIIYLINDVLHNAIRKTTLNVKSQLQEVIVPIYCHTFVGESQENQQRCGKVVRIWETNSYFDSNVFEKLKNPVQTKEELKSSEATDEKTIQEPKQSTETTSKTKNENEEGENTATDVSDPEQQENTNVETADTESSLDKQAIPTLQPPPQSENLPFPQHPPADPMFTPDPNFSFPPPNFHQFPPPGFPRPPFNQPPPGFNGHPMPPFDPNFPRPPHMFPPIPPQQFDYNHGFSDQAPAVHDYHHGQGGGPVIEEQPLPPQAMYYELPAGLMVPLINSPDVDYKPLNPDDVKLPPPQPPSERLIAAVEAFYSAPSHERPRNSEGWEAGALHEFYKTKLNFIKEREFREKVEKVKEMAKKRQPTQENTDEEKRSRSRSKSPEKAKSPSPKRRSRSRSPVRRRSRSRTKSRSRSRSPRRRRSRSMSRSSSGSRSRSRSRSKSRSPRRKRSRSPPPRRRSPTPPSFTGAYLQQSLNTRIDESNVGHQLLKKMGWEGAGLGKSEQGIQDPIKQGEVRDKQDMFKGIGVEINDPFDRYRKNMSYTYNRPRRDRDRK